MDAKEAAAHVAQFQEQSRELVERIQVDTTQLLAIQNVLQGYADLFPELLPEHHKWTVEVTEAISRKTTQISLHAPRLRGQAAVAHILNSQPDADWSVADVVEELSNLGWLPDSRNPEAPVRTALERLREAGGAEKVRTDSGVRYRSRVEPEDGDYEVEVGYA